MTKLEFMKELESLLSDILKEEREEALQYYNGYFEDAGEEHEQEIIEELGSPEKVAAIIKESLNSIETGSEDRGYFTEKGYQNPMDKDGRYQMVGSYRRNNGTDNSNSTNNTDRGNHTNGANNTNGNFQQNGTNNMNGNTDGTGYYNSNGNNNGNRYNNANGNYNNNGYQSGQQGYAGNASDKAAKDHERNTQTGLIILLVIVLFFGWPVILGVITAIIGIIVGFGVAGVAMIICGIALVIAGLIKIAVPFVGALLCGSGLLVLGLGMLFTLACVMLCKNVLPGFVKWILDICRRPFQNRSVAA